MAGYRNRIIRYALQHDYDGLFLVDSDLILHPQLLEYLRASGKKAVSELFWIKNRLGTLSRPNAWLMEKRALDSDSRNAAMYKKEAERRKQKFSNCLKTSGIYQAGGLAPAPIWTGKPLPGAFVSHPPPIRTPMTKIYFSVSSLPPLTLHCTWTPHIRHTIYIWTRTWKAPWIISEKAEAHSSPSKSPS